MRPTTRHHYRRFKAFYAKWWNVSPSTYYRVIGYSNTGYSAYVEMHGVTRLVPVSVLTFDDLGA